MRQTEVEDHGHPVGAQHDVLRLEVAVQDSGGVGAAHGSRELGHEARDGAVPTALGEHSARLRRSVGARPLAHRGAQALQPLLGRVPALGREVRDALDRAMQIDAADQVEHEPHAVAFAQDVEHRHDVRDLERGESLGLLEQVLGQLAGVARGADAHGLERHATLELEIARAEDDADPTLVELGEDLVAAGDHGPRLEVPRQVARGVLRVRERASHSLALVVRRQLRQERVQVDVLSQLAAPQRLAREGVDAEQRALLLASEPGGVEREVRRSARGHLSR